MSLVSSRPRFASSTKPVSGLCIYISCLSRRAESSFINVRIPSLPLLRRSVLQSLFFFSFSISEPALSSSAMTPLSVPVSIRGEPGVGGGALATGTDNGTGLSASSESRLSLSGDGECKRFRMIAIEASRIAWPPSRSSLFFLKRTLVYVPSICKGCAHLLYQCLRIVALVLGLIPLYLHLFDKSGDVLAWLRPDSVLAIALTAGFSLCGF